MALWRGFIGWHRRIQRKDKGCIRRSGTNVGGSFCWQELLSRSSAERSICTTLLLHIHQRCRIQYRWHWNVKKFHPECIPLVKNWFRKAIVVCLKCIILGKPFERGAINGKTFQRTCATPGRSFQWTNQEMIPSDSLFLYFLNILLPGLTEILVENVTEEDKEEIYGSLHRHLRNMNTSDRIISVFWIIMRRTTLAMPPCKVWPLVGCTSLLHGKKIRRRNINCRRNLILRRRWIAQPIKFSLWNGPWIQVHDRNLGGFIGAVSGWMKKD